jgi:SAM-dependent methyltransferase
VAETVSSEDLKSYYGEAYYNGEQEYGYADYLGCREKRMAHYRSVLPTLRRYLRTGTARILDVGCAAGFFLEVAEEAGYQAQGVELSPYISQYAREQFGLEVITGTIEAVNLPKASFDLITMWDVIEHLSDPRSALVRAHELLAPGAHIVISTGDISGATARIYGSRWSLLAPPGHLFYFSRKTLFAMLRQTGFEPLDWQSDGAFLLDADTDAGMSGRLWSAIQALHHRRLVNAGLRRLKLGSIITVYARRCGNN